MHESMCHEFAKRLERMGVFVSEVSVGMSHRWGGQVLPKPREPRNAGTPVADGFRTSTGQRACARARSPARRPAADRPGRIRWRPGRWLCPPEGRCGRRGTPALHVARVRNPRRGFAGRRARSTTPSLIVRWMGGRKARALLPSPCLSTPPPGEFASALSDFVMDFGRPPAAGVTSIDVVSPPAAWSLRRRSSRYISRWRSHGRETGTHQTGTTVASLATVWTHWVPSSVKPVGRALRTCTSRT